VPPAAPTNVFLYQRELFGRDPDIVTFPTVTFATSYIVQRASESAPEAHARRLRDCPGGADVTGPGSTITFTDNDPALQAGKTYFYQVYAVNSGGDSPASTPVAVFISSLKSEGAVEVDVRAATLATGSVSTFSNLGPPAGPSPRRAERSPSVPSQTPIRPLIRHCSSMAPNSASSSFESPSDLNGTALARSNCGWKTRHQQRRRDHGLLGASRRAIRRLQHVLLLRQPICVGLWGGNTICNGPPPPPA